MKKLNRIIFAFCLLGLLVTAFLAFEYSRNGPIVCPITGVGCDQVKQSQYSSFWGIQLPYLGIIFYLAVGFLSIWLIQSYKRQILYLRLLIAFLGVAFGIYLTMIEALVIKAYCIWCVSSFIISIIIFILCFWVFKKR